MGEQSDVILVFGATGRATGTAAAVARSLLERGQTVRTLVRHDDERARSLREQGAEVVFGDFADRRTLVPALNDVRAVQFTYPVAAGVIAAAANVVSAIREVGNDPHVVVCSMGTASEADSPSGYGRDQFVADELITTSLPGAVALKFAAANKTAEIDNRAIERATWSAQPWVEFFCCFFIELRRLNQFSCRFFFSC